MERLGDGFRRLGYSNIVESEIQVQNAKPSSPNAPSRVNGSMYNHQFRCTETQVSIRNHKCFGFVSRVNAVVFECTKRQEELQSLIPKKQYLSVQDVSALREAPAFPCQGPLHVSGGN
jgi:hypothetical protein